MADHERSDLAARPLPFLAVWGVPILILTSMNFAHGVIPFEAIVLVMAGTFVWMGLACVLNARRCRRRHCYYSGPVLLAGAAAIILVGFEILPLGPDGLIYVVWGTLGLVALTFVPEFIWGRYVGPKDPA